MAKSLVSCFLTHGVEHFQQNYSERKCAKNYNSRNGTTHVVDCNFVTRMLFYQSH